MLFVGFACYFVLSKTNLHRIWAMVFCHTKHILTWQCLAKGKDRVFVVPPPCIYVLFRGPVYSSGKSGPKCYSAVVYCCHDRYSISPMVLASNASRAMRSASSALGITWITHPLFLLGWQVEQRC